MGRPKLTARKHGGVDFKKIKKKIGRRLPPPKNTTKTEIKSKAIVLPEQSLVADRTGLAQSSGLTLKELLQLTSHTNVKSRIRALTCIRELLLKNQPELKLHKLAIIEKLRERITDDDKKVCETLYELLESVIFPGIKEETPGPFTSLIMAYIFNAMTHLSIHIRLMAFEFFDLVVQHYPSSILSHAEKVLQNYEDILRKNHIYLEDKGQLKSGLLGLVHYLSMLPHDKKVHSSSFCKVKEKKKAGRRLPSPKNATNTEVKSEETKTSNEPTQSFGKNTDARRALHLFEPEVSKEQTVAPSMVKKLEDLMPVLFNCFQELAPSVCLMPQVDEQSLECMSFVLQSIDLAVKFFVYGIDRRLSGFEVSGPCMHKKPDGGVWGETVMPMLLKKLEEVFPVGSVNHHTEKVDDRYNVLNVGIVMIFLHFGEWIYTPTILMEKFMQFIESMLSGQIFSTKKYNKALRKEYLVSLLPFIPRLLSQAASSWKSGLLQVFTSAFKGCRPESSLCLAFLSAIEEMLLPSHRHGTLFIDASDLELIGHQIAWIQELPDFLVRLGNDHPSSSKAVLQLQLRLGQCAPMSTSLASEYDSTQYSLREFYCTFLDGEGEGIRYGPFVKLPKDCQELAVSCLYYFSNLDPLFLKTLACCCLCKDLETFTLFRIIEVLQASYKSGHIQIADHISFFITILAHFKVSPEKSSPGTENEGKNSTHKTFKAITSIICSCVSQMGDNALVHQMIHKTILYEMSLVPTLENACAMLRMLVLLDFGPTRLLDDNIISLSNSLWSYLMDAAYYSPELSEVSTSCNQMEIYEYLLLPCLILFDRSDRLLTLVLNLMGSSIVETNSVASSLHDTQNDCARSRSIEAIASTLIFMHKEVKIQRILSSHKSEIGEILHNIFCLQSSKELSITLDERHKVKLAFNHLKTTTSRLHGWSCDDFRTS